MNNRKCVILFPGGGSGSQLPEGLWESVNRATRVWDTIDEVCAEAGEPSVSEQIIRRPDRSHLTDLATFGLTLALYDVVKNRDVRPYALLGHSFGHLAALTCAQAFTIRDSARIMAFRDEIMREWGPEGSGMLSVESGPEQTEAIVAAVGDPRLGVACYNTPKRTVVAGPKESFKTVMAVAEALGVSCAVLPIPYPYHGPEIAAVVQPMLDRMAGIHQRPLQSSVYSPTSSRYVTDEDDLVVEMANALLRPVRFFQAIQQVHSEGVSHFIECGARPMLVKLVRHTVPDVEIEVVVA